MRVWAKIMVAMGATVALVTVVLTVLSLHALDRMIAQAERTELEGHMRTITQAIALEARQGEAMSALVATLPDVQEHFAARDRDALARQFLPVYDVLAKGYDVEQFQFHTPPATSFLRLHKPEKYGDDLSSFRHTVVIANQTHQPTRGLEVGVAGLGLRAVMPVFSHGTALGTVEFGLSFGQAFFDHFKAMNGADVALYLLDKDKITPFGRTYDGAPIMPEDMLRAALAGTPQFYHSAMVGRQKGETGIVTAPRAAYARVIPDYAGDPLGVIEISMDRSAYQATFDAARNTALLVGAATLLVGLMLSLLTARGLTRRISLLIEGVGAVARGDLANEIPECGADELGDLARAARDMRHQLHDLAQEVRTHTGTVDLAARDIAGAIEGQAATSSQMSASVAEITSTMEELSASSTQIAEHSKSVVEIANTTYESAKKGSEAMALVLGKMDDIESDNQNSLREILDLGNKSKEISRVMEIINAVADQTKLIAFNAALEAASAGDAGRRFGVVAAEIRRLADSVTDSTGEIETKIGLIQDSISRLVITSEKGASTILAGREATTHTAERMADLVEAARQTSSAAQQISLSTQQQRTASTQVVIALREIVAASSHTAQSLARVSEISREMAHLSADLGTLVNRFRLSTATSGETTGIPPAPATPAMPEGTSPSLPSPPARP
ncbi:methyl-accepting chemotaxis protein [Pararhodospirillum oryzae]|nr:methyl-accepting chemotaxis protein [Pararhodospirillum oryzae]